MPSYPLSTNLSPPPPDHAYARYFVTNSVVQDSDIGPCGVYDFQVDPNDDKNGEGVCESASFRIMSSLCMPRGPLTSIGSPPIR